MQGYGSVGANAARDLDDAGADVVAVTNGELLTLDVDVLVPAAIGGVINAANADDRQADIVVVGANGPTTSEADTVPNARGGPVVPELHAHAVRVTASYVRARRGRNRRKWPLKKVMDELEEEMNSSWYDVVEAYEGLEDPSWRDACYVVALRRLGKAYEERGLLP